VVLDQVPQATIVPAQALTRRNEHIGVFVVDEDTHSVIWHEVKVGIQENDHVQVEGQGLSGRVVTLGQQMINDGSSISIPAGHSGLDANGKKVEG
jgi:multidrug efflux pump subunit AcrA (membrane-fusion protein)